MTSRRSRNSSPAQDEAAATAAAAAAHANQNQGPAFASPSNGQVMQRGMASPLEGSTGSSAWSFPSSPSPSASSDKSSAAAASTAASSGSSSAVPSMASSPLSASSSSGRSGGSSSAASPSMLGVIAAQSSSSSSAGPHDSTLAKRSVTSAATGFAKARSGPTHMAPTARPSSSAQYAAVGADEDSDSDEESLLLSDADMSIEAYMRRHPCVLDKGSAFVDRHPWIYQMAVGACTCLGVAVETMMLLRMEYSRVQIGIVYAFVMLDLALFAAACLTPPGKPPRCPDEQSVIQLLHGWPASSHHYGLHASEWSRSWSFCHACVNWRPARSHHCTRCGQCVLLMDHHCVWVGQCVGANNFRRFVAYCASITTLSLYALWVCYQYVQWTTWPSASQTPGGGLNFLWFGALLILALGGLSAGGYLSLRCAAMAARNETHIEAIKKSQFEDEARRAKMNQRRNLREQQPPQQGAAPPQQQQQQQQPQTNKKTDAIQRSSAVAASSSASSSSSSSDLESALPLSSPSALHHGALYFSPFQCACHASSFRVLYCQNFNYPTLRASREPIPPLPFYFDYSTGGAGSSSGGSGGSAAAGAGSDWGMNAYLFLEDLRRMEKLHQWIMQGSRPIRERGTDKHMRIQGDDSQTQQQTSGQANATAAQPQSGIPSQLRVLG